MVLFGELDSALMELFENLAMSGLLLLDSLDFLEFLLQLFLLLDDNFIWKADLLLLFHISHTHVFEVNGLSGFEDLLFHSFTHLFGFLFQFLKLLVLLFFFLLWINRLLWVFAWTKSCVFSGRFGGAKFFTGFFAFLVRFCSSFISMHEVAPSWEWFVLRCLKFICVWCWFWRVWLPQ